MIPTPAPVVRLKSRDISTSVASRALRKSYKLFKDSVDPDSLVAVLYSNMLLTPDERERATQKTETANQRLQVILMALERRISADPNVFHTLLTALMAEPALEAVGRGMKGEFGEWWIWYYAIVNVIAGIYDDEEQGIQQQQQPNTQQGNETEATRRRFRACIIL